MHWAENDPIDRAAEESARVKEIAVAVVNGPPVA